MKKILMCCLSLLLVACSFNVNEDLYVYNDGDYKKSVKGYGGEFEIMLTLKDDKIIDITVDDHSETPSIGGVAIEQLITKMIEKNNYDVDIITGATITSNALINGVRDILIDAKK